MKIEELSHYDLIYVGSPYTKYPGGIHYAYWDICRVMGRLIRAGLPVFSPIAHAHPIAIYGDLEPLNYEMWMEFDEALMQKSDAMLVAMMPTWEESKGIQAEMEFFTEMDKPIYYLDVVEMVITARAKKEGGI